MEMGGLRGRPDPAVASRPGPSDRSQIAHAVSAADEASLLGEGAIGARRSVGSPVDSPDFRRNLHSVQRKHSMRNSNGVDPIHLRQLRPIPENLSPLPNRHLENHNYYK